MTKPSWRQLRWMLPVTLWAVTVTAGFYIASTNLAATTFSVTDMVGVAVWAWISGALFVWFRPRLGTLTTVVALTLLWATIMFIAALFVPVCVTNTVVPQASTCTFAGAATWAGNVLLIPILLGLFILPIFWVFKYGARMVKRFRQRRRDLT